MRSEIIMITFAKISVVLLLLFDLCGCQKPSSNIPPYINPKCPSIVIYGYSRRGDLIYKRETAQLIGKSMIDGMNSPEDRKRSGGAAVVDLGRTWKIVEFSRKDVYGGGVEFQIDKCTGTITNLHIYRD